MRQTKGNTLRQQPHQATLSSSVRVIVLTIFDLRNVATPTSTSATIDNFPLISNLQRVEEYGLTAQAGAPPGLEEVGAQE